ncbi:MAG: hypothetical protein P1V19_05115 [Gimesia sp.]|nr:hypothetical protein [Gimesia sp.]
MHVESRCPSCQGSGQSYIGSPTDPYASSNCFNCHGTGRVTEYINTADYGGGSSAGAVQIDTRTDEERTIDRENGIASFLSFCLSGLIIAPVLMEGKAAWWIPIVIGTVFWIVISKVLQGPLRIIPVLTRKLIYLTGILLAYTMASLVAAGCLYVVIKIIQGAN